MKANKIVITGGPCAGKTTALKSVKKTLEKEGYKVLIIAETASELMQGGITPQSCGTRVAYQECQFELQLAKERIVDKAAESLNTQKTVIVCDRGLHDNKAYMTEEEFLAVAGKFGFCEAELLARYDAVFHLVTAALGAEDRYTTKNNAARTETIEQARELDKKTVKAWAEHPYHVIIENGTGLNEKIKKLNLEIVKFLNEDKLRKEIL